MAPAEILHYNSGLSLFEEPRIEIVNPGEHTSFNDSHGNEVSVYCAPDDSFTSVEHKVMIHPPKRDLLDLIFGTEQPAAYTSPIQVTLGDGSEFRCGEGPILSLVIGHKRETIIANPQENKQEGV